MLVTLNSVAAGRPGRGNEDFVGAIPTAAVLLDGAGGVAGAEAACRHGVAWYARRLGAELLGLLSRDAAESLPALLAEAIELATGAHRDTCDVTDPASPWATVAVLRVTDGVADHLVLGDAVLLLDRPGGPPLVVTDDREDAVAGPYRSALRTAEGEEYERIRAEGIAAMRAARNRPGGYWIAKDDPAAAGEALTGSHPVGGPTGAALLSNGAARLVEPFGIIDWPEFAALLTAEGPAEIIRRVRAEEARQSVSPDDASIAHCTALTG
ncbi:hypothetical protein [Phytomonospora endophytica]|uniref:Protein phosphatase 2C-like protein n=1 Tax=Phytomonospora endophytica TaxID=714109 RepID=A0A841FMA2_9ACTN|nr:hypothetical protein [Phytomonospora endophytica]MBB6034928.1 hypothetical protein [Phytomonospora endophytica]GIG70632.1 hypothetical protein Pen01_69270 [Phytomonospora endophytica]